MANQRIRFEEMPEAIQAIFDGVGRGKKNCQCSAGVTPSGDERYYVKTVSNGETSVFAYRDGCWTAIKHYG